ncbi:molybdopterin cofactor-binding domain-containing protein [Larkinella insperata]|uniref:Molybdopterin cofactor-binding domain-containing protein n=1 Tax=Larkinella insperata TaxID=332158 RepID=A0ABW3Q6N5_9BACT|nr:molybdopterin cofactor-binding domain-containing protein [Larkinella insperata]
MTPSSLNRRSFLKAAGLTGTGFLLGFTTRANGSISGIVNPNTAANAVLSFELVPFIVIDNAGGITLINHRPDMGQGSWQAVPTLIAEELEVSLDQISVKQSDGLRKYGSQLSGGSSTVRTGWKRLREAGAATRQMFTSAAATRWNVPVSECYAENGAIKHKPSGKSFTYGELVDEAAKLPVPEKPILKTKKDFKLIGKPLRRSDIPSKVTGKAVFGMDLEVPGMLYASIEHCPVLYGKATAIDDSKARKIPGVKSVLRTERPMPHRTSEAVAVLATNYWAALQGRRALEVTWDKAGFDQMTTERYFNELRQQSKQEGILYSTNGDFKAAYETAPKKLEGLYQTPFLAHAPMEPEVAIAHVKDDGSCEIWAPVQGPDGAIQEVAGYLKIKPEQVKVHVPFLGGAFGRKAYLDFVLEAVHLSRLAKAPVKLIWTREDDVTQGPFRPGMLSAMRGAVDAQGNVVAFEHKLIGESIQRQVFSAPMDGKADDWAKESIGKEESPYAFPNAVISNIIVKTEIPVLWWRSVYASNNSFGHECFVDELAHAAGKDPLAFRLGLLEKAGDEPVAQRFIHVLNLLREKSGWDKPLPAGQGKGIAIARSFGSQCAHAVFVEKGANGLKVKKVVSVLDCGMYVNPDNVRAQTEGNIVYGLTAALKDGITFANGQAEQTNFHNYRVMRMDEMPEVDIHLVENEEEPGGVGEPGLPPVAPALCNAIFSATGKRIRTLPVDLAKV